MDRRGQIPNGPEAADAPAQRRQKKTDGLLDEFQRLWDKTAPAFAQRRVCRRAGALALSALVNLGRGTITGWLCALGAQFQDWSAAYRVFSRRRFDPDAIWSVARRQVLERLDPDAPLVVAMDDSLLPKSTTKTPGAAWRRDPLGPPFQVNLIRAQRILQISAALPRGRGPGPATMIPIDLRHCPTPARPKKTAPQQEWAAWRLETKRLNINLQAAARLACLGRSMRDDQPQRARPLHALVDNRFTNRTILKNLPDNAVLIGRLRKDCKLFFPPPAAGLRGRGRARQYGPPAQTPEQILRDPSIPWQSAPVHAAGSLHDMRVKAVSPLRWRANGPRDVRVIVIAPLSYRLRKGSKLLYRRPAYLIVTDPNVPVAQAVQEYVWRWGVEVNFRDQKQLVGVGQAQVRHPDSVETVPTLAVAAYALLLLAAHRFGQDCQLPRPKWRRDPIGPNPCAGNLIRQLRAESIARSLGLTNFSDFSNWKEANQNPNLSPIDTPSAILYATG